MNKYTAVLMHKDDEVCSFIFDGTYIDQIKSVKNADLLPCRDFKEYDRLKFDLQRWLFRRVSGRNRSDFTPLRTFYGNDFFVSELKTSLFDCYWLKKNTDDLTWDKVNPYKTWDPEEDEYFGIIMDPENTYNLHKGSPNLTIPGNEHRFWYVHEGKLGIITESSQKDMREYKLALSMGFDKYFYPRQYIILSGTIYSFHPVDENEGVERIAFDYYYEREEEEGLSKMENLEKTCEKLGIKNWQSFFNCVCRFDETIGFNDRELSSFGILRDSNTLKPICFERL